MRYLLTAVPAYGHVLPLLSVARLLVEDGHEVVFATTPPFAARVRSAGARYVQLGGTEEARVASGIAVMEIGEPPERRLQVNMDLLSPFIPSIAEQTRGLRAILETFHADALIVDQFFLGVLGILGDARCPPVVVCGVSPLPLEDPTLAPYHTGLPPATNAVEEAWYRSLHEQAAGVWARATSRINEQLESVGASALTMLPQEAMCRLPKLYLQFCAPSFEYPRIDTPANLRFVGDPPSSSQDDFVAPPWWHEIDGTKPVIAVSQGTVANNDASLLIGPAVEALAKEDVLVIIACGGQDPSELKISLPANARAEKWLPFDRLLPKASLFISNGGYGGIVHSLSQGVPVICVGITEEKLETGARVDWSGTGIHLRTSNARDGISEAIHAVSNGSRYRERVRAMKREFSEYDARVLIREALAQL